MPTPPTPDRSTTTEARMVELFGGADAAPRRRRRRRRLAVSAIAVLVLAVTGTAVAATNASGSDLGRYRTATVATHDVDAVLTGVATIEPVSQATVSFPVGGTVATVPVAVGDTVGVGQTLATLDTTSFNSTLHTRQAALAATQLKLTAALEAAAAATTATTTTTTTVPPVVSGAAASGAVASGAAASGAAGSGGAGHDASLTSAQQEVTTAQAAVDAALKASEDALANASSVCSTAPVTADGGGGASPAAGARQPADLTTPTTVPSTVTTDSSASTTCQQALAGTSTTQRAVDSAQRRLQSALTALGQQTTTASGNSSSTAPTRATGGSGTATGVSTGSGGSHPSAATVPSAEDLVADQQAVDAALAEVAAAMQAVDQATIVSPIAGTVVGVTVAPGDTVTSASTTATVTVAGTGGYEATTKVDVDHIAGVRIGQTAAVLPDGSDRPLPGQVVSVAAAPTQSTTSTNYLVLVALSDPHVALPNGGTGSLSMVTGAVTAALAVPTSAVTTRGTRHQVTVLTGTSTRDVQVQVGVVGDRWTEIRGGLTAGQTVVLADLSAPLPTSATQAAAGSSDGSGRRTVTLPNGQTFQVPVGGFGGAGPGAPPAD